MAATRLKHTTIWIPSRTVGERSLVNDPVLQLLPAARGGAPVALQRCSLEALPATRSAVVVFDARDVALMRVAWSLRPQRCDRVLEWIEPRAERLLALLTPYLWDRGPRLLAWLQALVAQRGELSSEEAARLPPLPAPSAPDARLGIEAPRVRRQAPTSEAQLPGAVAAPAAAPRAGTDTRPQRRRTQGRGGAGHGVRN